MQRVRRSPALAAVCVLAALGALTASSDYRVASFFTFSATDRSLGVVIPLSSMEKDYAAFTISQAARVAGVVSVAYADFLADGTPEDLSYVDTIRAQVEALTPPGATGGVVRWVPVHWFAGPASRIWVRYLRYAAFGLLPRETRFVLWIDADEVVDAPRFQEWWASASAPPRSGAAAVKLANYFYFRDERYQRSTTDDSAVITRRDALELGHFFDEDDKEREMFYDGVRGRGPRQVRGLDGAPLIHHYSWVREGGQAGLLRKVSAWTHNKDRDWASMVRAEFAHDFTGRDFLQPGVPYITLERSWLEPLRAQLARGAARPAGEGDAGGEGEGEGEESQDSPRALRAGGARVATAG